MDTSTLKSQAVCINDKYGSSFFIDILHNVCGCVGREKKFRVHWKNSGVLELSKIRNLRNVY